MDNLGEVDMIWEDSESGVTSSSGEKIHVGDTAGQQFFLKWVEGFVSYSPKNKMFFIQTPEGGFGIREGEAKLVKRFEPEWIKDII